MKFDYSSVIMTEKIVVLFGELRRHFKVTTFAGTRCVSLSAVKISAAKQMVYTILKSESVIHKYV